MRFNIYAIKTAREQHGWTQEQLGERCGLTRQRISQIESGDEKLNIRTLEKIWRALGFHGSMSFFVEDKEAEHKEIEGA